MTTDDAKPIIRTLRDVLLEARAFVQAETAPPPMRPAAWLAAHAGETLERVDGAIAEADEVLS